MNTCRYRSALDFFPTRLALPPLAFWIILGCLLAGQGPTSRALDNQLTQEEKQNGWILLFDGVSTNGWMTSAQKLSRTPIEQSSLNPHKSGHYMLVHTQQWSNFVLSLDFKISKGCNSGVFLRTFSLTPPQGKDVGWNGLEVAIDDTQGTGYHDTGAIYDLVRPTKAAMKPAGEWNSMVITCKDQLILVQLNGEEVTRMNLDEFTTPNKRSDGSSHKFDLVYKNHPRSGYIGLQDHGSPCWFKNIKIKPL